MKNTILLLTLSGILISFFSCKNDSVTGPGNNLTALTSISGNVENWTLGSKTIKLTIKAWNNFHNDTVAEVSTINPDGSFSFNNLPLLRDSGIGLVSFNNDTICSGNITMYPNGLKAGSAFIYVYSSADSVIGSISKTNSLSSSNTGYIQLEHCYFTESGNISGQNHCSLFGYQWESSYNAVFPAKWYYLVRRNDTSGITYNKTTITSTEPPGLKWYYNSYYYDDKKPDLDKRSFIK